jgi:predicted RecB family nuclease
VNLYTHTNVQRSEEEMKRLECEEPKMISLSVIDRIKLTLSKTADDASQVRFNILNKNKNKNNRTKLTCYH